VVIAKQGAGGTIAMADVARAAPDGYTIAFATQGTLVFNTALYSAPGYDSLKDFAALALVGNVPNAMIVPASSRFNDLHDVIAVAKAKPGEITFSSGGSGTSQHLSGVLFEQFTQTQLLHVPYSAAPQALRAVITGEVAVGFFNIPAVIAQIRSGNVKALAVTGRVRSPLLPEVPTLNELGLRGYEVNLWFGFVAPVATPPEIVARLNREITSILALPKLKNDLVAQGMELAPAMSPAEFMKFIRDDTAKWIPIVRGSGARTN
jgi:tripartite-type tricarboxylate transporter receptor subunit TctC